MSLRKRENLSQSLPYVIGISIIKVMQFQRGQKSRRNLQLLKNPQSQWPWRKQKGENWWSISTENCFCIINDSGRKSGDATRLTKRYDGSLKIPECSSTTGPLGGKTLITEAPSVQVLSSSSKGDDYNFDHEPAPSDASKFSHMTEEEIPVVAPKTELPLGRPLLLRVFFSTPVIVFLFHH